MTVLASTLHQSISEIEKWPPSKAAFFFNAALDLIAAKSGQNKSAPSQPQSGFDRRLNAAAGRFIHR